ncbi:MAG: hypothetical protein J6B74_04305 [Ruminococcus sp.]|nr:hypothetical protein [Ruminococcus sp.]
MNIWTQNQFKEIEIRLEDEQYMYALINGDYGWIMYLREEGDSGFSSRNPDYNGSDSATMKFTLSNGQVDDYPLSWILPADTVNKALLYFEKNHQIPDFINWHDDSNC